MSQYQTVSRLLGFKWAEAGERRETDRTPVFVYGNEPYLTKVREENIENYSFDIIAPKNLFKKFTEEWKHTVSNIESVAVFYGPEDYIPRHKCTNRAGSIHIDWTDGITGFNKIPNSKSSYIYPAVVLFDKKPIDIKNFIKETFNRGYGMLTYHQQYIKLPAGVK